MTVIQKQRWVQLEYGSVSPSEHTEGDAGPDEPIEAIIDGGATSIPTFWRFRDFNESRADPQPSPDYAGPLSVFNLANATRVPIRRTFTKEVPQGQYELRFKRVSPPSGDDKVTDDVAIGAVRSIQPDLASYEGRTLTMVEIRASGQLNGTLSQFNGLVQQQASYVFDDGLAAYVRAPSSNPGRVLLAWLLGGFDSDGGRLWGGGIPIDRIDTDNLDRFASWCYFKELYFDAVIDQPLSVFEVASRIARCGRGTMSMATGKWGVVWDEGSLPVTAVFTPMNMLPGTFKISYATGDQPDEIVLNYIDRTTWKPASVFARQPGVDAPQRSVTQEVFGCTTAQQAIREVRLAMSEIINRSRRISWQVDIEGLAVRKGDVVSLSHDMCAWGTAGRLIAGTSTVLTLDRNVTLSGAQQYISIVTPQGQYLVSRVRIGSGETNIVTLVDELLDEDDVPIVPDDDTPIDFKFQFDSFATPGWKVKIINIEPAKGFNGFKFTAVDEVAAYYQAIGGDYGIVETRTNPRTAEIRDLVIGEEVIRAGAGYSVNLRLAWSVSGSYSATRLRYRIDAGDWQSSGLLSEHTASIIVPPVSNVELELVGFDAVGRKGAVIAQTHMVKLGADLPPNVPFFFINGSQVTWGDVVSVDLDGYRIRWQPGNNTSWYDANDLHTGLLTDSPYTVPVNLLGPVTLMIRAVDVFGNESEYSAIIRTQLGDALIENVVELFDERTTGFLGVKTGCAVVSGDLKADDATGRMWKPDDRAAMWGLSLDNMWHTEVWSAMTYAQTITPAAVKAGARLVIDADIVGESWSINYRKVGAELMWSLTTTDPMWAGDAEPMWLGSDAWYAWPGALVLDDGIDYEFVVSISQGSPLRGQINKLDFIVDNPDIVEYFNDIAISASGTRLPISASFDSIKNVTCTLQDDGGTATTLRVIDKNHTTGPLIECLNAAGAAVSGSVDSTVKGY